ncbi:hypothetical protein OsJ_05568 [Oryza sativa Japonica Group]|uniref:Secreted protein n=1 Tax=Oryza sativa subsp. japonica TaxID=39947 RepID=B9F3B1_ORYSJ|nr:hypothetical protein OsJ_05568 [Oryza sativa Japonica Group]
MMARNVRLVSVPVICLLTFSAGGGGDGADEAGDLLLPSGTSAPCRRVPPPPRWRRWSSSLYAQPWRWEPPG